jgi:hypothetical protein
MPWRLALQRKLSGGPRCAGSSGRGARLCGESRRRPHGRVPGLLPAAGAVRRGAAAPRGAPLAGAAGAAGAAAGRRRAAAPLLARPLAGAPALGVLRARSAHSAMTHTSTQAMGLFSSLSNRMPCLQHVSFSSPLHPRPAAADRIRAWAPCAPAAPPRAHRQARRPRPPRALQLLALALAAPLRRRRLQHARRRPGPGPPPRPLAALARPPLRRRRQAGRPGRARAHGERRAVVHKAAADGAHLSRRACAGPGGARRRRAQSAAAAGRRAGPSPLARLSSGRPRRRWQG